jgi:hypothetical protein
MPILQRFGSVSVRMYADDHHPPHFHIVAPDFQVLVSMISGASTTTASAFSGKLTLTTALANTAQKTPPIRRRPRAFSRSCWPRNIDRGRGCPLWGGLFSRFEVMAVMQISLRNAPPRSCRARSRRHGGPTLSAAQADLVLTHSAVVKKLITTKL